MLKEIELNNDSELEEILKASKEKPQVIFKHSTRCSISRSVHNHLQKEWSFSSEKVDFYYLDLLNHRAMSNKITQELQVHHESPQLILLKGGGVVKVLSHFDIKLRNLVDFV